MMPVQRSKQSYRIIRNIEHMSKSVRNILNLCIFVVFLHSVTVKSFQKIMLLLSLKYSHFIERNRSLLRPIIALLKIYLIQILLQVSKELGIGKKKKWYVLGRNWDSRANKYSVLKFGYVRLREKTSSSLVTRYRTSKMVMI